MQPSTSPSLLQLIRSDVSQLHAVWMSVLFPRQRNPSTVTGRWSPDTVSEHLAYDPWFGLGIGAVLLLYPILLGGYITRYYAHRLDTVANRVGVRGVVAVTVIVWGSLSVVAHYQFGASGFTAVLSASFVAVLSASGATLVSQTGGRGRSVVIAYPLAVTAFCLPPVVAALYSPTIAGVVFPTSTSVAVWLLNTVLTVGGVNTMLRSAFQLQGVGYVGMWFGLAFPIGWILGGMMLLASTIRPSTSSTTTTL